MKKDLLEISITINAPVETVWRVLTDPVVTAKMGGKYVTDWKIGGEFNWMSNDSVLYNRGTLLKYTKYELIEHDLYDALDTGEVRSTITYHLTSLWTKTLLTSTEGPTDDLEDDEYREAEEDWAETLETIKKLAEKL